MYLAHFQLKEQPFQITPDSDFLYMSEAHTRAKAYMDYTIKNKDGFVVITGEVGSGKTTLIRKLLSEFDERVLVAKIFQTQLDDEEFLAAVLNEFGVSPFGRKKVELMDMLTTFLIDSFVAGKQLVLIVDEAQNLSPRVLEEIRLLSGLETQKQKILHVILVGQPELNATLDSPELEQLLQRVRLRFHIAPLTEAETRGYVAHRLRVAGAGARELFAPETIPMIYEYSGGIPRLINMLCDTAMTVAFADDQALVTLASVKAAVEELRWEPYAQRVRKREQGRGVARPNGASAPVLDSPQLDNVVTLLSVIVTRLEGLDASLKQGLATLDSGRRVSIRLGRGQLSQILRQLHVEDDKDRLGPLT